LLDSKNDVAPEKLLQKMYRFYHYLKPVLPCADAEVMVQASKVVGRIAKIGGVTLGERFFEFEVMNALELMKGKPWIYNEMFLLPHHVLLQVIDRKLVATLLS
jgi:hypothetical protein